MSLIFGTAGIPLSTKTPTTIGGVERIRELGLEAMEVQFVRGVKMGEKAAQELDRAAKRQGVALSVHAPYYINLNSADERKIKDSKQRIFQASFIGRMFHAHGVVFHPAFYQESPPEEVYSRVKESLTEVVGMIGEGITLRPETTGKKTQFGDLDETLRMCHEIPGCSPCIDFAHLHARTGALNSYNEFLSILEKIEGVLGREALQDMHIHISGISYGKGGELKHLTLDESDLCYLDLLRALKEKMVQGMVICESPNLEEDALLLKKTYNEVQHA
jgi:deoxyribonuclease-4